MTIKLSFDTRDGADARIRVSARSDAVGVVTATRESDREPRSRAIDREKPFASIDRFAPVRTREGERRGDARRIDRIELDGYDRDDDDGDDGAREGDSRERERWTRAEKY